MKRRQKSNFCKSRGGKAAFSEEIRIQCKIKTNHALRNEQNTMIQPLQVSFCDIICVLFNYYRRIVKNWFMKYILSVPLSVLKLALKGRQTTFQVNNYYFFVIMKEKWLMWYIFILISLPILSILLTYVVTFLIENSCNKIIAVLAWFVRIGIRHDGPNWGFYPGPLNL